MEWRDKPRPSALRLYGAMRWCLYIRGKSQGQPCHNERQHSIDTEHKTYTGGKGQSGPRQQTWHPGRQRSCRSAERGDQVVASEDGGSLLRRGYLGDHRLVDGQKGGGLRG